MTKQFHNDKVPAKRPGRFTLRELFILMGLVAFAGGFYSWIDDGPELAVILFEHPHLAVEYLPLLLSDTECRRAAIEFVVDSF